MPAGLMERKAGINLEVIKPDPRLMKYILSFWIFEHSMGGHETTSRIIVPTGCAKIVFPLKNDLFANGKRLQAGKIHFVGISDEPVAVSSCEGQSGNVIIKVKWAPHGAYRFAPFGMDEVVNSIFSFDEVFGHQGKMLQDRIGGTDDIFEKIGLLQEFMVGKLTTLNHQQGVVDYAAERIIQTKGLISMKELER